MTSRPRCTVEDRGTSLRITIPGRREPFWILLLVFWQVLWWSLGIWPLLAIPALVRSFTATMVEGRLDAGVAQGIVIGATVVTALVVLGIWAALSAPMGCFLLWRLRGEEIVEVSNWALKIGHRLWRWERSREYRADEVSGLSLYRAEGWRAYLSDLVRHEAWRLSGRRPSIAMQVGGRRVRWGEGCSKIEAEQIIGMIQERFPVYREKA